MHGYSSPEVEFVEFDNENIIATSPECEDYVCNYDCPEEYGNTCTGNPYGTT